MPELPEVEKMTQKLQEWCSGQYVKECKVSRNPRERYSDAYSLCVPRMIKDVFRRGKIILFDLEGGPIVSCHNAMSGFWDLREDPWTFDYVEGKRSAGSADVRVEMELSSGKHLRFHDARLFGSIKIIDKKKLDSLGPEAIKTPRMLPGSPTFNILDSAVFLSGKKPIKQLLLEQQRLAGVGNIYAAEALWRARIHPERKGVSLKGDDHQRLTEAIQSVLKDALAYDLRYDDYLKVYRRSHCKNCGQPIEKIEIAGRSTYFCSKCQK